MLKSAPSTCNTKPAQKNLQIVGEKGSKAAEFGKVCKDKGKRYLAHQKNLHLILVLHTVKRFL